MRNFIIFGPPGAGKGTQAQKIANEFNLHHLSTGALLREEISRQTEIGQKVQKIMDQGVAGSSPAGRTFFITIIGLGSSAG